MVKSGISELFACKQYVPRYNQIIPLHNSSVVGRRRRVAGLFPPKALGAWAKPKSTAGFFLSSNPLSLRLSFQTIFDVKLIILPIPRDTENDRLHPLLAPKPMGRVRFDVDD